ncbi:hypothetical protein EJB05_34764 [Eragrostis curvula]|uniref:Serpin domain-containing protein n=1 Tax=Eragrostis curvula TaxID=38414 RepID=A0A5J9U517_9POAL|nr:hypothetical protein EJB05_34764 [Eragrostis curvula]
MTCPWDCFHHLPRAPRASHPASGPLDPLALPFAFRQGSALRFAQERCSIKSPSAPAAANGPQARRQHTDVSSCASKSAGLHVQAIAEDDAGVTVIHRPSTSKKFLALLSSICHGLALSNSLFELAFVYFFAKTQRRMARCKNTMSTHMAEVAREEINNWVSKATKELITSILPEGSVHPLTRLVLTNAIYFKGTWKEKFNKKCTQVRPFYRLDGSDVRVPFMSSLGDKIVDE